MVKEDEFLLGYVQFEILAKWRVQEVGGSTFAEIRAGGGDQRATGTWMEPEVCTWMRSPEGLIKSDTEGLDLWNRIGRGRAARKKENQGRIMSQDTGSLRRKKRVATDDSSCRHTRRHQGSDCSTPFHQPIRK